ncbi:MAG TPA: flagellar biosynthetic protein FliO [Burkholderiaceae bacterium]|jgi:flagellar protein FliO/FliZ
MTRLRLLSALAASLAASGTALAADQPSMALDLFKVLFGLLVVLGAMAGVLWLLKRAGVGRPQAGGVVKVVGGVSVGNRERVLVLEIADQWIVVGVAPGRVSALANLPRQEQVAPVDATPPANQFAVWLKQKIDKRNASQ